MLQQGTLPLAQTPQQSFGRQPISSRSQAKAPYSTAKPRCNTERDYRTHRSHHQFTFWCRPMPLTRCLQIQGCKALSAADRSVPQEEPNLSEATPSPHTIVVPGLAAARTSAATPSAHTVVHNIGVRRLPPQFSLQHLKAPI